MSAVELSASPVSSLVATANLTVNRPRIKRISISGYRAFPPYRPDSFEVNLGNDGKNLLLYGENGSGKTSLFRALRELFSDATGVLNYDERRNAFAQENDDSVVVELTSGTPSEFRWQTGEDHPKETEGAPFRNFARSCLFLDYRDLLETNFVHRRGSPDLFQLLVRGVLRDLPVPTRALGDLYQHMLWSNPRRRTVRQVGIAEAAANGFSTALANHLPEVVAEGNRLLGMLQSGVRFSLQPGTVEYDYGARGFSGQNIPLTVTYDVISVSEPQYFLNEARLTALALSIYLTATSVIEFAKRLLAFQKKVEGLVNEWAELEDLRDAASPAVQEIVSKRFFGKKKKGEITPHSDFFPYVLQVLVEMGGSGKTRHVLDRVGEKMKNILKPLDYAVLPSDGKSIRWRNSAQWARNTMVNEDGRMKKTKNGIWEISDKGRKWLATVKSM